MPDPTTFAGATMITTARFAELLAPIAQRETNKAYSSLHPTWRPLQLRDRTYFGRKRRARRDRGRRDA